MRYVITGGCGFIGTNLIYKILNNDPRAAIVVVDNLSKGTKEFLPDNLELIVEDITNESTARSVCRAADVVIHLASHTGVLPSMAQPDLNFKENVFGTFNYLEAARINNVKKFIFASSGGTIAGNQPPPINEEVKPMPVSPYGCSKLCGEFYCLTYKRAFDLDTVVLRFSNVYGSYSAHKIINLIPSFILKLIRNEPFFIHGDGKQTRDFIYVEDLINAIWLSIVTNGVGGNIFQLATGKGTSVLEMVKIMNDLSKKHLGRQVLIDHKEDQPGEIKYNYCDISKAVNILKFNPSFDLYDGLEETLLWFLKHYNKQGE